MAKGKGEESSNGLQNTTQKTKDCETRTPSLSPVKIRGELRDSERDVSSCSTSGTRHITVKRNEHHKIWK
jgi:hypothetical protein